MNSSKRKRHGLYFWIDVFFLSFPLVFIVGVYVYFFISYSLASKELFNTLFNLTDSSFNIYDYIFNYTFESFYSSAADDEGWLFFVLDNCISWIFSWDLSSNSFINILYNVVNNFFDFLGLNLYTPAGYFNFNGLILNYICYIIVYEFLSFFIQVVLWIPRFFKSELYDRGLME